MEDQILALLKEEVPEVDFETDAALVDDGILDSFAITSIIAALSMEYGITIPYEEIVEENFNSVAAMAELVNRLR